MSKIKKVLHIGIMLGLLFTLASCNSLGNEKVIEASTNDDLNEEVIITHDLVDFNIKQITLMYGIHSSYIGMYTEEQDILDILSLLDNDNLTPTPCEKPEHYLSMLSIIISNIDTFEGDIDTIESEGFYLSNDGKLYWGNNGVWVYYQYDETLINNLSKYCWPSANGTR